MNLPLSAAPLRHLAVVMDGNGRWATRKFLPRIAGHKQGVTALSNCVRACLDRDISVLTVFAFSSENWSRPEGEVSGLMDLLAISITHEVGRLTKSGVQLHFIGDRAKLSSRVQQSLAEAEQATTGNQRLVLNVCFNYGGRWDITQAAQTLATRGEPITEESLSRSMAMSHVGDPDLLVRTGGEYRLSNFLLWQSAYTELYFSPLLWPDFDDAALDDAIVAFRKRDRRFGQTDSSSYSPKKAD